MLDVHEHLAILSKNFQSNSLAVYDIARNVNKTLKALQKLGDKPGPMEASFWTEVKKDQDADMLRTCSLEDGVLGRELFKEDRKQVLTSLDDHLISRYQKVLDDPVLLALRTFDHALWPDKASLLENLYYDNIETLYNAFNRFFEPSESLDAVQEQFSELAIEIISSPGLRSLKHHALWARMLLFRHREYRLALRLIAISLLIPVDTSECERIFSLMNDIKTAERSRMGSTTLRNLMLWHRMARLLEADGSLSKKHIQCRQVPVMAILEKFRDMAGVKGRTNHRAFPIPSYDYELGRTKEAKLAAEQAKYIKAPTGNTYGAGGSGAGSSSGSTDPIGGEQVDNAQAGGIFQRLGREATMNLGAEAGVHSRVIVCGGSSDASH